MIYKVGGDTHIPPPMIFADTNWLNISINLLLVVFVIVCLMMSLLILMQRPKQEGLGAAFGGGVTDQVFGARTTNVLQRGTVYLGSMFFILALSLAILIGQQSKRKSLLEDPKKTAAEAKSSETPGDVKIAEEPKGEPKSLVEELPADAIPAPPAGDTPAPPADAAQPPAAEPAPEPVAPGGDGNKADKPE